MAIRNILIDTYNHLLSAYGSQSWWPADTPFEVMVGAILTQNTAWSNVESAIAGLKDVCSMDPESILSLPPEFLQEAIRPSGYFRQKAERLRTLCDFLIKGYQGVLSLTQGTSIQELRRQFLALKGIGPETADSILLYALERPVFVVDAYTRRLFSRLGLCPDRGRYVDLQALFMKNLDPDTEMFNEYHALIVNHAKERCMKREPICGKCVLREKCTFADSRSQIPDRTPGCFF